MDRVGVKAPTRFSFLEKTRILTKVGDTRIFATEQNTLHYPGRRDDMASEKVELIFVFENPNTFTEVEQELKKRKPKQKFCKISTSPLT